MTFDKLGLAEPILRAIASEGYTTPTPIQAQAIPPILSGTDLLGNAPTGTGKTAAFALPIVHRLSQADKPAGGRGRRPRVLVLSPTRELALQIADSFKTYGNGSGLRHTAIYGGVNQHGQVRDLKAGVDLIIATPGRLVDLMNQGFIDLRSIEIFVLDEADRMLDMGFLPDLRKVIDALPTQRQSLLFSATMPAAIERLAEDMLRDPVKVRLAPAKATTDLIKQSVCFVPREDKGRVLTQVLAATSMTRAIVFTRTKHGADRVAEKLRKAGIAADAIHGNKSQAARQRTLAGFKSNLVRVLVATDIAARGIDVDNVSHVVNFDLPHEPETYVHRIGRTGRAGCEGVAVSFCDPEERSHLRDIERLLRRSIEVDRLLSTQAPTEKKPASEGAATERPRPAPVKKGVVTKRTFRPGEAVGGSGSRKSFGKAKPSRYR